jgi:excisionase family DNA binding protein
MENETAIKREQDPKQLLTVAIVNTEAANQAQPDVTSGGGKQSQQVKSDSGFEPLLDVAEAARLLRMHPRTLRTKARERIIPAVQVGRRWRFRASTLNDWLGKLAS